MTTIKQADFIQSIADALQHISYYHPADYITALAAAYEREQSPAAKDAIAQILTNSRMCAEGHRPICQDTGIVVVFLKVGMNVRWDATLSVQEMVDEGVRRAYLLPDNVLRASIVSDPAFSRKNTRDNTPAVVHTEIVPGDTVDVKVAAKGGGSENKSKFAMLNPSDSIVDWVLKTGADDGRGLVPAGHAGHRHRRIGREGDAVGERVADGTHRHVGAQGARSEEQDRGDAHRAARQGQCAGHRRAGTRRALSTVLDVKIYDYPTARRVQAHRDDPELCAARVTRISCSMDRESPNCRRPSCPTGRTSRGSRTSTRFLSTSTR
jgi:fumarate hydratase class I